MGGDRKPARKEDGEKREGRSCDGSSEVNLINRKSEKKSPFSSRGRVTTEETWVTEVGRVKRNG